MSWLPLLASVILAGPEPAPAAARDYSGPTAVLGHGVERGVEVPVAGLGRHPSDFPPRRPTVRDLFMGPAGTASPGGTRSPSAAEDPLYAPPSDPLPRLRDLPPDGRGLLITGGVVGGLAALAGFTTIVVGHAHVKCDADPSYLVLAPCKTQVSGHQAGVAISAALYAVSLPFLAAGAHRRARYTIARGRAPLGKKPVRTRTAIGATLIAAGAGLLVAAYTTGFNVVAGTCEQNCMARFSAMQATWWFGAGSVMAGTVLLAHTAGRRPKRTRSSELGFGVGLGSVGLRGAF